MCAILDQAGFFQWSAMHVARWGGGNGQRLFTLIIVLGAGISALFANDGTALTLTPIVFGMVHALGVSPRAAFALVMATGFIADTASMPLVVSNLVNIVIAEYFGISFARYALIMVPVTIISVVTSLIVLRWFFRRDIPPSYDLAALQKPRETITDPLTFKVGAWMLLALLAGYFLADPLGIPVAFVALSAAAILIAIAARPRHKAQKRINIPSVLKGAPWQIVIFSLGMYLVVYGLRNEGLTDHLGTLFTYLAEQGTVIATTGTGVVVAGLSSIMNNMPTTLIAALGVDAATMSPAVKE